MSVGDWVTGAAATVAAGASVLTYRRLRRQDRAVGWLLEPGPAGHMLVRTGGGVARNVDIEFDGAALAIAYVEAELHQDVVHPGAQIRVAKFAPPSSDVGPGRVHVTWDKRRFGWNKRAHWSTTIA